MTEEIIPWVDQLTGDLITSNDQMPVGTIGFVYCITNLVTGKKYIGKKMAVTNKTSIKTVTLKNGTKKKKKNVTLVPSDWPVYYGSSQAVMDDVEKHGKQNYKREILLYGQNKGSLGYFEARLQMDERVLERPDIYYNKIVNCRVHASHVKPLLLR